MSCVEGSPGYWTVDLDRVVAEALESDVLGFVVGFFDSSLR